MNSMETNPTQQSSSYLEIALIYQLIWFPFSKSLHSLSIGVVIEC